MKPTDFSYHLTKYLSVYLPNTRGFSSNTIASRRDTFALLLRFCSDFMSIPVEKVTIKTVNVDLIIKFIEWLEEERGCTASTRNQRLAAVKALFKYLQTESPEHIFQCQQILSIPLKKTSPNNIEYLSLEGIKAVLGVVDIASASGRRDMVLLSVLYDSGARVQELADLTPSDIRLQRPETIRLTGKGSKTRIVPIMDPTAKLLSQYMTEKNLDCSPGSQLPLFPNRAGNKLTRAGISYILSKYVEKAKVTNPILIPDNISPHCFRHSKAMHMLQSGVPLIYIRDFLGHEEISTTEIYARIDGKMKRQALENAYEKVHDSKMPIWQQDHDLMQWLKDL